MLKVYHIPLVLLFYLFLVFLFTAGLSVSLPLTFDPSMILMLKGPSNSKAAGISVYVSFEGLSTVF